VQAAVLDKVQKFANNAPQFDDITLMILERDA
jgi:serine phosphatase RsbU (regulator of sigma subunit)